MLFVPYIYMYMRALRAGALDRPIPRVSNKHRAHRVENYWRSRLRRIDHAGQKYMKNDPTLLALLIVSMPASADPLFNCADLVGTWQSSNFEYSISSQKTFETTFHDDNTFVIAFRLASPLGVRTQVESGRWECDGRFVTMHTRKVGDSDVSYKETYTLLELNSAYRKYQAVADDDLDCENIVGDCEAIIYEGTKKL